MIEFQKGGSELYKQAIVRKPSPRIIHGLSSASLGLPDYALALKQHSAYVKALKSCGLKVHVMSPDDQYPDATFIEDTALLTPSVAIVTRPGAESRRGEIHAVAKTLKKFYEHIDFIQAPGTIEAGDILMVGSHFYVGLSQRTNLDGALQMIDILNNHGYTGSVVKLKDVLHLKTGLAYLEQNHLVVCGEFVDHSEFSKFRQIEIPQEESYAANCIWVNDTVIIPAGYPITKELILAAGYPVLDVDVSEFEKLDGGLSCLSLRF